MFATGPNPSQKMAKLPTKPIKIEMRSTILSSTESSRAKQATATIRANLPHNTKNRLTLKSQLTSQMPSPGKTVKDRFVKNTSRKSSSTDTLASKNSVTTKRIIRRDSDGPKRLTAAKKSFKAITPRSRNAISSRASGSKDRDNLKSHLWQRNKNSATLVLTRNPYTIENIEMPEPGVKMGVQTNEKEILNHSLVVGDIKFLLPSPHLVEQIEKQRKEIKSQKLLKATRKFEAHSERQEEHLNDLKEFLEKSYVTKKVRKSNRDTGDEDSKLFTSMDQFFNKEMPKTESFSDIKARIKRKEQELINLFDNVQCSSRLISKSS